MLFIILTHVICITNSQWEGVAALDFSSNLLVKSKLQYILY